VESALHVPEGKLCRCRLEGCVKPGLGRNICLFWDPPVRAEWGTGVADGAGPPSVPPGPPRPRKRQASPGDGWAARPRRDPETNRRVFYGAGLYTLCTPKCVVLLVRFHSFGSAV
jgi:hypothetical protein